MMNNKTFHYSSPTISPQLIDSYTGSNKDKELIFEIVNEWNSRISISYLCNLWKKERPLYAKHNLSLLLYNVEGLNTHVADVDSLLSNYHPHIGILTGVGAAVHKHIIFPNYYTIAQPGT